jgi:serine/threonine protein kinase
LARCAKCREALEAVRENTRTAHVAESDVNHRSDFVRGAESDPEKPRNGEIGHLPRMSVASTDEHTANGPPDILFGDYQILGELPQGGQAIVYKAIHTPTKTKVALKVLLPALLGSPKARWQFEREVELSVSLCHPSIVTIRDSGISRGQYYFSMEYIHGKPLDQYVSSKSLSLRDKMTLFCRLCEAMTHAHQRGVIHRDLKPSNVLVDERGEPHILDFGLAKAAGNCPTTPQGAVMPSVTGQLKGTLSYMSPEQAAGRTDLIDVRTDVYSLGIILYQMLMGRFPYDVSGSHIEVLRNIQDVEPERPRHLISRMDSDVETILLKALAKDLSQRYQSAAELHHDVRCWLEGLPIVAKSVSSLYLLRKVIARHRYTSAIVGLLVVIVSGFFTVYFHLAWRLHTEQTVRREAVTSLAATEGDYVGLSRQAAFLYLLDLWHRDQMPPAESIAVLDGQRREGIARRFLLDPAPLAQKMDKFKMELKDEPFFAQFVIAEHLLKNGNAKEAQQKYRDCMSMAMDPGKDQLIKMRISLRAYDLSREDVETRVP